MRRVLLIAAFLLLTTSAQAKGPPHALPDWPCDTSFAGPLDADALWPGVGEVPQRWDDDPTARALVEALTAGENSPAMARQELEAHLHYGPLPRATALRVLAGMIERGNLLRVTLLSGIKQQVIRSHILAAALAEDQGKDAATRRQNLNQLDDTDDAAEHLCRRLVYDETKLRGLATLLKDNTQ